MQLTIHKDAYYCNSFFDNPPFNGNKEQRRYNGEKTYSLDISKLQVPQIKLLRKTLETAAKNPKCNRLVAASIRDIDIWLDLRNKHPDDVVIRSMKSTVGLFRNLIALNSKYRHIYSRGGGILQPYYVSNIVYIPTKRDKFGVYPEHIIVTLSYLKLGAMESKSFSIYKTNGLTPREVLHNAGFTVENAKLRAEYEANYAEYDKRATGIGQQYLATGKARTIQKSSRWYDKITTVHMEIDGRKSKVVVDVLNESGSDEQKEPQIPIAFWKEGMTVEDDEDEENEEIEEEDEEGVEIEITESEFTPELPVSMFVPIFCLSRHERYTIHITNLEPYPYDNNAKQSLVLPESHTTLIDALLLNTSSTFKDVIDHKQGGIVVLLQGKPGTGKTLTAEVYAEALERPLYTVQCSQLGLDAAELESELIAVLRRGQRWGAVMLLDEADVYVHERGNDLMHNAIVGVFLRVLEYQNGVLFFTTNRGDTVDDAILSRCTARVNYDNPSAENLKRIWASIAKANGIKLSKSTIDEIIANHPDMSGRDVKNLLKLASLVAQGNPIDAQLIARIKEFKPT